MDHKFAVRAALPIALLILALGCSGPTPEPEDKGPAQIEEQAPATAPPELGPVVELADAATQIAAAVTAAPEDLRDAASVYGYDGEGGVVLLRQGDGELICLADNPGDERFHAACYHHSLELYMARGRQLRAEGVAGSDTLTVRHDEIDAGTLAMPRQPAVVYTLAGDPQMHDPESGSVDEAQGRRINAIYVAYATEASTGLSQTPPQAGAPWIMRPGTPSAHIMVVLEPPATVEEAQ